MDFYRRMALVCACLPSGQAATYGQIALLCGKPRNARQVGAALNRGLAGDDIPAHRIVNASGGLSGAAAFDMPDLQKWLLEEEGVQVTGRPGSWQVDLDRFGWNNTIEEALALTEEFKRLGI